tara:strand:+ start:1741 stop:2067 length:327 start_codon:yes stop_codon:yes gene_type:complete
MNTYNKKTVIALYRSKMRICNNLGYSFGQWNDSNLARREDFNIHKIKKSHKKNIGAYIMDNCRFRYKLYKEEFDNEKIGILIDDGFSNLRKLNKLHKKEKQFKEKLYV